MGDRNQILISAALGELMSGVAACAGKMGIILAHFIDHF